MIWIGYQKDSSLILNECFFLFCDETNTQLDYIEGIYSVNSVSGGYYKNLQEWKDSFSKNYEFVILPTDLKKLPKTVKEFKKVCRDHLPEVFL